MIDPETLTAEEADLMDRVAAEIPKVEDWPAHLADIFTGVDCA